MFFFLHLAIKHWESFFIENITVPHAALTSENSISNPVMINISISSGNKGLD